MTENEMDRIVEIQKAVKKLLSNDTTGHDYTHTERVYRNALKLAKVSDADLSLVSYASLLHDVDDPKLFDTDDFQNARDIMNHVGIDACSAQKVIEVIKRVSYKGGNNEKANTLEAMIVQDADRLDAIGAIGIARAFAYGGAKNRPLYDRNVAPRSAMTEEEYRSSAGNTLNHFYEKLLKLKDLMNTDLAKQIAEERHSFMAVFLEELRKEIGTL